MQTSSAPLPLPCLMGPTGAGKTAAALALAERFPLTVINTDSRQVYRDFPLITAQPSPEERALCPHELYGYLPTSAKLGAGQYVRAAGECIARVHGAGRLPLAVGGTGLYFKALVEGLADIPEIPEAVSLHWQERCAAEGSVALHALLLEKDPVYAAKIHPNDKQRITRALEVWQATGTALSEWHAQNAAHPPFKACKLGIALPLDELTPLLARRIDLMLAGGAIEEARAALRSEPDPSMPGWTGIGCAEVYQYLAGTLSLEECKALWLKNTRAYAKRQLTWFRADPEIAWFTPGQARAITEHVDAFLQKIL